MGEHMSRESGLVLIEDANRWERAYREARDNLAGAEARAERAEAAHGLLAEIALLAWKATGGSPDTDPAEAWNDLCSLLERQPDSFPDTLARREAHDE